jgi:hypothetical protein
MSDLEYKDIVIELPNEQIDELLAHYVKDNLTDASVSKFTDCLQDGMTVQEATINAILNHVVNMAIQRQLV